ncbi:MAG: hypothetical protein QOK12_3740 [Mycobacterium sp.]|jgi:hypothetical protein|nr:hypothetical protein [Mycobacterium sp.]
MRINKTLAVAAAGLSLAAAAAVPAVAGATHHAAPSAKTKIFPSTLTPHSGIKSGTKMVLKGHGAKKNTNYSCVFTVLKGSNYFVGPITPAKSNARGKIKCTRTFQPYTAVSLSGGGSHKCPLSHKDKKHHYRCALDLSTTDKSSATNQYFTTK